MDKFFRNFFYSLLSTTFLLSQGAIANIQKRILVTEFVQSKNGELAEIDGLGDTRKDIIFKECLRSSISNNRFNEILANGGKVVAFTGNWQNKVEYLFDNSPYIKNDDPNIPYDTYADTEFDTWWEIESGICIGKGFITAVDKSVYEKIVNEPEDNLIRKGPYSSLFKYKNEKTIYNQKYFHFVNTEQNNKKVNVLIYLDSGHRYHIVLNKNNTFSMTSSNNGSKDDLSTVKGTWKRKANNHFHLVFDNGDYVTLEKMEV